MKLRRHISSVKTKVTIAAAALYLILMADWCSPGFGLHRAASVLGGYGSLVNVRSSVWGLCVQLIGWDVRALGILSVVCSLVCMAVCAQIASDIVRYAVTLAKIKCVDGTTRYHGVSSYASVLAAAAFFATPGLMMTATRVDPLPMAMMFVLSGLSIVLHYVFNSTFGNRYDVLKEHLKDVIVALVLFGLGVWEFFAMGRAACTQAVRELAVFVAIGVMPLLVIAWVIRVRKLRKASSIYFVLGCWAFALAVSCVCAIRTTSRGREVSRVVGQIIDSARSCDAILSEGYLDDMLLFMKPNGLKLISLVRDNDERYRRDLVQWVEECGKTNLIWAAEIGPRTLIDKWLHDDRKECLSRVRTSAYYFPTVKAWHEACGTLGRISPNEPLGAYMRKLMTACGNDIGCRFIDDGDLPSAWKIFWEILDKYDRHNCTAIANLYGMIKRGYPSLSSERDRLNKLNQAATHELMSARRVLWAALSGGRIYALGWEQRAKLKGKEVTLEGTGLSKREIEFVTTVAAAPNSAMSAERAREAIRAGLVDGLVRKDRIGSQLLRLDLSLKDWSSAERDSQAILKDYPQHPEANGTLGLVYCRRGEFTAAERYLRAALRTDRADVATLNDLAFTLVNLGNGEESIRFAKAAVSARPKDWNFRETLAYAQIRANNVVEGEKTLLQAIHLAAAIGIERVQVARFDFDQAWLYLAQRNVAAAETLIRRLEKRPDLTVVQKNELAALKKAASR